MFHGATNFNQSLRDWNTTNVKLNGSFKNMFNGAIYFSQLFLTNWDVIDNYGSEISTEKVEGMFKGTNMGEQYDEKLAFLVNNDSNPDSYTSFVGSSSGTPSKWFFCPKDVSNRNKPTSKAELKQWIDDYFNESTVEDSNYRERGDMNHWNVSEITDMKELFKNETDMNYQLYNWDTSNVEDMSYMFYYQKSSPNWISYSTFNRPLPWNTSSVVNMKGMFYDAIKYNDDYYGPSKKTYEIQGRRKREGLEMWNT